MSSAPGIPTTNTLFEDDHLNTQTWPIDEGVDDSDADVPEEEGAFEQDSFDRDFPIIDEEDQSEQLSNVEADPHADLREVLALIQKYEKEPRGALEKVKVFIERILPKEKPTTYVGNAFMTKPSEVSSSVVGDVLSKKKWDFSGEEVAKVMRSKVDVKDKQNWEKTGNAVMDELQKWEVYKGLDVQLQKLTETTSRDRLSELLPKIVEDYAIKNGRKMTPEEREIVMNHAREQIALDPQILGDARDAAARILETGTGQYDFEQVNIELWRLGYGQNPYRREIGEEVVKILNEDQKLNHVLGAIDARLNKGVSISTENISEYIDQNMAAYIGEKRLNLTPSEIAELRNKLQERRDQYAGRVVQMRAAVDNKKLEQQRTNEGYYEAVNNIVPGIRSALQEGKLFEDRPDHYIDQALAKFVKETRYLSPHIEAQVRQDIQQQLRPEFENAFIARNASVDLQSALTNPNTSEQEVRNIVRAYLTERQGVTNENRAIIENLATERIMRRIAVNKLEAERKRIEKQMAWGEVNDVEKRPVTPTVQTQPRIQPIQAVERTARPEATIITNERFRKLREDIEVSRRQRAQSWGEYKEAA